jgi:hypothetical protein
MVEAGSFWPSTALHVTLPREGGCCAQDLIALRTFHSFNMNLRSVHRTVAALILLFAVVHLANHLASLSSVATHISFMDAARTVYRQPVLETLLLSCVAFQIASGLRLVFRGWRQRAGWIAWLQALSGAYLAFFLLLHVGAVLFGRAVLHLDTNFYFAAAGLNVYPLHFFFVPYYILAVSALFVHIGCAAYWQCHSASRTAKVLAIGLPTLAGILVSVGIVLSLAGMINHVDIPPKYKATFGYIKSRDSVAGDPYCLRLRLTRPCQLPATTQNLFRSI